MARQRRGGGFRPPELRGTLGTLLRTTLAQAGTLRDALERGAREGRSRLDSALSTRRRQDALAELGDIVLDLIRRGEIDVDELPEVRDIVTHLDEIDAGHVDDDDQELPAPPTRNRFDARGAVSGSPHRGGPRGSRSAADDEDGTVSSRTWSRPSPAKPQPRVWRPPVDEAEDERPDDRADDELAARERPAPSSRQRPAASAPSAPARSTRRPGDNTVPARPATRRSAEPITPPASPTRKDPTRKGGIHFDDDEDLAEYMHPDDVPPKTPPDGDS